MFYDLNLPGAHVERVTSRERLAMSVRLGYDCVAVSHLANGLLTDKDKCAPLIFQKTIGFVKTSVPHGMGFARTSVLHGMGFARTSYVHASSPCSMFYTLLGQVRPCEIPPSLLRFVLVFVPFVPSFVPSVLVLWTLPGDR
jgi:hypothetical protein